MSPGFQQNDCRFAVSFDVQVLQPLFNAQVYSSLKLFKFIIQYVHFHLLQSISYSSIKCPRSCYIINSKWLLRCQSTSLVSYVHGRLLGRYDFENW